jgi:ATP-binding cassette subfamily C protein LapB
LKSSKALGLKINDNDWSRGWLDFPKEPPADPGVLLASFTLNVLSLGLPIVILQVYDRILPNSARDTLLWLVLGLVAVLFLDGFLRMGRAHIAGWAAARFEHIAGCRAVDRLLGSEIGSLEMEAPGVHLDRLQAIDTLRDYYAGQSRLLLLDLPFVCLFLGLMWFIGGSLVALPIAVLALFGTAAFFLGRLLKRALVERAEIDDRRISFIIEALRGIHTVKLMAMEALLQRRYEKLQESGASST